MSSPFGKTAVIANPRAGKGWVSRRPEELRKLISDQGIDADIWETGGRGDATALAGKAVADGYGLVVAVGGDGTVHEVVNGLMKETGAVTRPVLGVIPAGSGCDFVRTFGLPQAPTDAVRHLAGENLFPIDVGLVRYRDGDAEAVRYFPNIAEAGLGGVVVRRAEGLPRFLGRVRYLLGFWMALGTFKPSHSSVVLDGHTYEGSVTNLVVANAQFFGGGMHIAPKAHPGDGKFDVLIQSGTKRDYIAGITKVYKGEHLSSPAIKLHLSSRVEVTANRPLLIEADGEVLGTTPATFEIVPEALSLKI